MPKRISVAAHLSLEELEKRYSQAKDGIESRQYQIIWLIAPGKKTQEVEEITGYREDFSPYYKLLIISVSGWLNKLLFTAQMQKAHRESKFRFSRLGVVFYVSCG